MVFDFPLRDVITSELIAALQDHDIDNIGEKLNIQEKREKAIENIRAEKNKWKDRFDARHAKPPKYDVHDLVVIELEPGATGESRKLKPKFKGPYVIKKCLGNDRYLIEDIDGLKSSGATFSSVYAAEKLKPRCKNVPELYEISDDDDDHNYDDGPEDESN